MELLIAISLPTLYLCIDFLIFLVKGKRIINHERKEILDIVILVTLIGLFSTFDSGVNDCCGESSAFSPKHRLTVLIFILTCVIAFIFSALRKKTSAPLAEVILNGVLLAGMVFNVFMAIQVEILWFFGNLPIIIIFVFQLIKNHFLFLEQLKSEHVAPSTWWQKISIDVLKANHFIKFPILLILSLPVFFILSAILLLFGQQPDSMIRAFTDTYKHAFSQLDYQCANVKCGGHFLCSVGANGHRKVVKPVRYGERHGKPIVCNRQLLVSNAFEELLQEKLPRIHRLLRKNYNRIGLLVHRYYGVFSIKIVSDIVYVLMKPAECIFLIALYLFDSKPENRIARQYLRKDDRQWIEKIV